MHSHFTVTESPLVVAVFWALSSSHSFFSCGHTTTVTSLRVEAAFTGINGEINKYNLPLAGFLVGLNTLGPQVIMYSGATGNHTLCVLTETAIGSQYDAGAYVASITHK